MSYNYLKSITDQTDALIKRIRELAVADQIREDRVEMENKVAEISEKFDATLREQKEAIERFKLA